MYHIYIQCEIALGLFFHILPTTKKVPFIPTNAQHAKEIFTWNFNDQTLDIFFRASQHENVLAQLSASDEP